MPSRATDLLRVAMVLAAIAAATACVIGPKQDDPSSLTASDASIPDTTPPEIIADSASGTANPDGSMDNLNDAAAETAAPPAADADCVTDGDAACGDAATDAVSDAPEGG